MWVGNIGGQALNCPKKTWPAALSGKIITEKQAVLQVVRISANGTKSKVYALEGTDSLGGTWECDLENQRYYMGDHTAKNTISFSLFQPSEGYNYTVTMICCDENGYFYWGNLNFDKLSNVKECAINGTYLNGDSYPDLEYGWPTFNIFPGNRNIQIRKSTTTNDWTIFGGSNFISTDAQIYRLNQSPNPPDPNEGKGGNSEPGGGEGTRPIDGDAIPAETPDPVIIDSGFLTVFTPSKAQIQSLAQYLWAHLNDLDGWKKLFADPMDVIIGCHVLPVSVPSAGSKEIKPGLISTGITAGYTDKQFVTKDLGTLEVPEYWGSALDFAPYTRVSIFLPFIGMRTLDTDLVMGKTIHLYYQIEVTTGALLAQLEIDNKVLYEFSGNCAMQIPISGNDYRSAVTAALSLAATIGAGIASGGTAAAPVAAAGEVGATAASAGVTAATVASIANATVGAVMNSKPSIERTGSLGGAAGYMGVQTPYIIVEYPKQSLPKNYMKYNGYPCNMSFTLGDLTGYTQCETVRFKTTRATDEERKEIVQFLQAGVILGGTAPTKPSALSSGIGVTGYQNGSEDLVVNKTLTAAMATQTCYLKKDTEITRPTIILNVSEINFNYVYIDKFDRFYYVTGVRSIGADRWEVDLRCDTLTSFSDDIGNASAIVSRQENEWNLYLDDGSFKAYQILQTYTKKFPTGFSTHSYVLLVSGS